MRRSTLLLPAFVAAAALGLTACSDDESEVIPTTPDTQTATATETSEATDAPQETGVSSEADIAGERAEEWLVAFVNADPVVCDYVLNTVRDGAMSDNAAELDLCETILIAEAEGTFDEEMATIMSAITISGAEVDPDGDTAVVDHRHVSPLFADALGDSAIHLVLVEDEWLVDLDQSFRNG